MKNGTLYTGVTGKPAGRMWQHKSKIFPRSFSAQYGVTRLVWYEVYEDPSEAITREKRIKDWKRAWKVALERGEEPELAGSFGRD